MVISSHGLSNEFQTFNLDVLLFNECIVMNSFKLYMVLQETNKLPNSTTFLFFIIAS
jgi:hypothetical protein